MTLARVLKDKDESTKEGTRVPGLQAEGKARRKARNKEGFGVFKNKKKIVEVTVVRQQGGRR